MTRVRPGETWRDMSNRQVYAIADDLRAGMSIYAAAAKNDCDDSHIRRCIGVAAKEARGHVGEIGGQLASQMMLIPIEPGEMARRGRVWRKALAEWEETVLETVKQARSPRYLIQWLQMQYEKGGYDVSLPGDVLDSFNAYESQIAMNHERAEEEQRTIEASAETVADDA